MIPSTTEGVPAMSTAAESTVHQSRWGYHCCDRETFLEVKEYHKFLLRAFREYLRWSRWERKTVYRSGPEPAHYGPLVRRFSDGSHVFAATDRQYNGGNLYHDVLAGYRLARKPAPDPALVGDLELPQWWRTQLAQLRGHYSPSC